jgi:NRPS condensation-like uncharacterized protein
MKKYFSQYGCGFALRFKLMLTTMQYELKTVIKFRSKRNKDRGKKTITIVHDEQKISIRKD